MRMYNCVHMYMYEYIRVSAHVDVCVGMCMYEYACVCIRVCVGD